MKRETSFFRDRRANTAEALVETLLALGMSEEEIRDHFLKLKEERARQADRGMIDAYITPAEEPAANANR